MDMCQTFVLKYVGPAYPMLGISMLDQLLTTNSNDQYVWVILRIRDLPLYQ